MQKRLQSGRRMVCKNVADNTPRVTASGMPGMSANRADFAHSRQRQPFASHGDQLAINSNTVVRAHPIGSQPEVTWKSHVGESDHPSGISSAELLNTELLNAVLLNKLRLSDRNHASRTIPTRSARADIHHLPGY